MSLVAIYEFLSTGWNITAFLICFTISAIFGISSSRFIWAVEQNKMKDAIWYNIALIFCNLWNGYFAFVSKSMGGIIGMFVGGSFGVYLVIKNKQKKENRIG